MNPLVPTYLSVLLIFYALLAAIVPDPVALRLVNPLGQSVRVGFAPLSVRADVRIPRHPDNRAACVTLDGTMLFESCWQIDEQSPITISKWWHDLPGGHYAARARVQRGTQVAYSQVLELTVLEN